MGYRLVPTPRQIRSFEMEFPYRTGIVALGATPGRNRADLDRFDQWHGKRMVHGSCLPEQAVSEALQPDLLLVPVVPGRNRRFASPPDA